MLVFKHVDQITNFLSQQQQCGRTIGFLPTMGALHQGHISLLLAAKAAGDFAVCSIFVNPTQFNNAVDLEKYPKTVETDIAMLETNGCDVLFLPDVEQIYPEG